MAGAGRYGRRAVGERCESAFRDALLPRIVSRCIGAILSKTEGIDITDSDTRYTVATHKPVDQAAQDVEAALATRKFSVLWALDVNDKLREKGLDLRGRFRILEVCSAPRAKEALEGNPLVTYFLPCKVVVYERDGHTEIGLPRPTALMAMLGDDRLQPLAEEVERVLVEAVQEAAGLAVAPRA